MKLEIGRRTLTAIREPGDPNYYGTRNAAGESRLLYAIRRKLNAAGSDFIKKRMCKDGHLVDDLQQYLRTRRPSSPGLHAMIWNPSWAIRGANDEWNEHGSAVFALEPDPFDLERRVESRKGTARVTLADRGPPEARP